MSKSVVYSKPSCPYCVKAKALLTNHNIEFEEKILGSDITSTELFEMFDAKELPRPRTAPQIFLGGTYIGGYDQLVAYIEETGYNGTGHTIGT